ncbi:MAG: Sir2 family NAD-dependent protein deacetylase [Colwellia sp.]
MNDDILQAAKAIKEADAILISAGAGMGVDSGLPDFRGNTGFWRAYPALKKKKLSFVDLANPRWFHNDPHRAWGFYGHRYKLYRSTSPHKGFQILKKWCATKAGGPFIFTSNVDGHFQKAGFNPDCIYECHGSINHQQCLGMCDSGIWPVSGLDFKVNMESLQAVGNLPRCPLCGGVSRPNIQMFSDSEWRTERSADQNKRYGSWLSSQYGKKVVNIELGAGLAIPTVRIASESIAGTLIRINPLDNEKTPKVRKRAYNLNKIISLKSGALETLRAIDESMKAL